MKEIVLERHILDINATHARIKESFTTDDKV